MQKDNKNNSITKDDDLWKSITKNDKKYIKANRHVDEKLNLEKKIKITRNHRHTIVTENEANKNIIKNENTSSSNNRKIQELDPKKVPSGISTSQADRHEKEK